MRNITILVNDRQGNLKYAALRDEARRSTIFYKLEELSFDEVETMLDENGKMYADLACKNCHLVIATFHANEE